MCHRIVGPYSHIASPHPSLTIWLSLPLKYRLRRPLSIRPLSLVVLGTRIARLATTEEDALEKEASDKHKRSGRASEMREPHSIHTLLAWSQCRVDNTEEEANLKGDTLGFEIFVGTTSTMTSGLPSCVPYASDRHRYNSYFS